MPQDGPDAAAPEPCTSEDDCDGLACVKGVCAPPQEETGLTDIAASARFIYTQGIQVGVASGTIDDDRVTILRGMAYRAGPYHTMQDREPAADVKVTVQGHPEYGRTTTGPDGNFVMVVNAGQDLLLEYEKAGYLKVQRRVSPRPRDWQWAEDVVLTEPNPAMMLDGLAGDAVQFSTTYGNVRKGLQQTDGGGTRQAFVFFPPGVTANLRLRDHPDVVLPVTLPNGQPGLTGFGISEYTVGEVGRQALPLPLPPNSAYTYAVEITCDAELGGEVRFTAPVYVYVHNFTGFPVGSAVPSGYVDKASGTWIASDNGRVVKTLQFNPHVDATGTGANSGWEEIGMTQQEAQTLWQVFGSNTEVWRIPVTHFSSWDFNGPFGQDPNEEPPNGDPTGGPPDPDDPSRRCGSILECQNQAVMEVFPVSGTPYELVYKSSRAEGYAAHRILLIPLVPEAGAPPGLVEVLVEVEVAGQRETYSKRADGSGQFLTDPNDPDDAKRFPVYEFRWDGRDAFGRPVYGAQPVSVRVGYKYGFVYYLSVLGNAGPKLFGSDAWKAAGLPVEEVASSRAAPVLWKRWTGLLWGGSYGPPEAALGGLTLSVHHSYDPVRNVVHFGDGREGSAAIGREPAARALASAGCCGEDADPYQTCGDGGPARDAAFVKVMGVAANASGDVVVADGVAKRIRRIGQDGFIEAYTPHPGDMPELSGLALGPNGHFHYAVGSRVGRLIDAGSGAPVREIVVNTQGETAESVPDGTAALDARIGDVRGIAFGPEGNLCILDEPQTGYAMVREVYGERDGFGNIYLGIRTIAGCGPNDAGCSTTSAWPRTRRFQDATAIAVGGDGTIFVAEAASCQVLRIDRGAAVTNGQLEGQVRVAAGVSGTCSMESYVTPDDGNDALAEALNRPLSLAVGPDDSLFVGTPWEVRRVRSGRIDTLAGTGWDRGGYQYDLRSEVLALDLNLWSGAGSLAVTPGGDLLIGDEKTVWRIDQGFLARRDADGLHVPGQGGLEEYVFEPRSGRHLKTIDRTTHRLKYEFGYDDMGRLAGVTDSDGRETAVLRSTNYPTIRLESPDGVRTEVLLDESGHAAGISDPESRWHLLEYETGAGRGGLLKSLVDPRSSRWCFDYDENGRLTGENVPPATCPIPAGSTPTIAFEREPIENGYRVKVEQGGLEWAYDVTSPDSVATERADVAPGGVEQTTTLTDGAHEMQELPDGTTFQTEHGPDPTWGMAAPHVASWTVTTPLGRSRTQQRVVTRTVNADGNILSQTEARAESAGGQAWTSWTIEFERADSGQVGYVQKASSWSWTSPAGREAKQWYDSFGRPSVLEVAGRYDVTTTYDELGRLRTRQQADRKRRWTYDEFGYPQNDYAGFEADLPDTDDPDLLPDPIVGRVNDLAGRTVLVTREDQGLVKYDFDPNGNVEAITPPGEAAHDFGYSPVNLLLSHTPPEYPPSSWAYNSLRLPTVTTEADGSVISRFYDPVTGKLDTIQVPEGTIDVTTGPGSRIDAIEVPVTGTTRQAVAFAFDGPLLLSETWSGTNAVSGSVSHGYDDWMTPTAITVAAASRTDVVALQYDHDDLPAQAGGVVLSRDDAGAVIGLTMGQVFEDRPANGYGEPCVIDAQFAATQTLFVEHLDSDSDGGVYCPAGALGARDYLGRITTRVESVFDPLTAQVVTRQHAYEYDYGRLSAAEVGTERREYHYSPNGRRTWWANPVLHLRVDDDVNHSFTIWHEGGSSTEYRFNANGEIAAKEDATGTIDYTYDSFGRLKQVDFPGGRSIHYVLDGKHRRVGRMGKQGAGPWQLEQGFLYSGSQVVAELDGNGQMVSRFVYGSREHVPDYMVSFDASGQPTEYRILSDRLGTPRMVVRTSLPLEVVATYEYDEFGIRTSAWEDEDFPGLPFGFAGGLYDDETGLVHFGAREYDPEIGQWTSRDPILFAGGDTYLYGYVLSDPVNLIDPSGLAGGQCMPRTPLPPDPEPPPEPQPQPQYQPPPSFADCNRQCEEARDPGGCMTECLYGNVTQ